MRRALHVATAVFASFLFACAADTDSADDGPVLSDQSGGGGRAHEIAKAAADEGEISGSSRPDLMPLEGNGNGNDVGAPQDPNAGAGPKPATSCAVTKDSEGFFTRSSSKSSYVAYVPASYKGTEPVRLIVGLHGCGDSARNFAGWGINPAPTRASQKHIGISIGGRDGACWSLGVDDDKVLAAVDDISKCFWVHQKKVSIAGFSSGGQLAYRVGLQKASRFAGILIENSGLYAAGVNADTLLTGASWKMHIAHRSHTGDTVFPLAKVRADWDKTKANGFPILTSETPGTHDGVSEDWSNWLIPQSADWIAP